MGEFLFMQHHVVYLLIWAKGGGGGGGAHFQIKMLNFLGGSQIHYKHANFQRHQ